MDFCSGDYWFVVHHLDNCEFPKYKGGFDESGEVITNGVSNKRLKSSKSLKGLKR